MLVSFDLKFAAETLFFMADRSKMENNPIQRWKADVCAWRSKHPKALGYGYRRAEGNRNLRMSGFNKARRQVHFRVGWNLLKCNAV